MSNPTGGDSKSPFESAVEFVKNTTDHTSEFAQEDVIQNKVIAAVCYIPFLFFVPLVAAPRSPFGRFHANQSLALLLFSVVGSIVFSVLELITALLPPIAFVFGLLTKLFGVVVLLYVILGAVNTANGKAKELPLIGKTRVIHY